MQVEDIDIDNGKKGVWNLQKKYKISFLGSPTTPTYSSMFYDHFGYVLQFWLGGAMNPRREEVLHN